MRFTSRSFATASTISFTASLPAMLIWTCAVPRAAARRSQDLHGAGGAAVAGHREREAEAPVIHARTRVGSRRIARGGAGRRLGA